MGLLINQILSESSNMTVFTHATIYGHPTADAILCEDGKIKEIGQAADYTGYPTVDLRGGTVYPGFIDAHMHLLGLGGSKEILDLVGTKSVETIMKMVESTTKTLPPGTWIQGRGWDQNDWEVQEYPTKEMLDKVAPNHPVFLRRIDGHAAWTNSTALELASITKHSNNPEGGMILRHTDGSPSGILIDNALDIVGEIVPKDSKETKTRQILRAVKYLNTLGITAIHDAGTEFETIQILKELIQKESLPIRVYSMLEDKEKTLFVLLKDGPTKGDFLNISAIKLYFDGAMGSRGAALLEPYSDDKENTGLLMEESDEIAAKVKSYNAAGFQVCIHAIGDRANRLALDIFEKVGNPRMRNRIEHAQNIHPDDVPRFSELGVIPAMQPTHCTSDMYWITERIGEDRLNEAYPWKSLINAGSPVPGGSDAPIEIPNPLHGIYAAVTRQDTTGWPEDGWQSQECVSLDEAINMYTEWAAFGAGQEELQGRIEPGYYADFTVVSHPFEEANPKSILDAEVLFTIINGKVVFKK